MRLFFGLMLAVFTCCGAELFHDDFSTAKPDAPLPPGWMRYGTVNSENFTRIVDLDGRRMLRIVDLSQKETGLCRDFPVTPGKYYRATVVFGRYGGLAPADVTRLQLRFDVPGGKPRIAGGPVGLDGETVYSAQAPEGAKKLRIYIYTSFAARMDILLKSFRLEESDKPFAAQDGNVRQGFVPPIEKLKDLCRETPLDRVTIQTGDRYRAEAERLASALEKKTGRRPAVVSDAEKVSGHRILLGSRDTNRVIDFLYRKYFAYTDVTYPGPGGYELRTVHDPFGDKSNFVIAGGSDDAGVREAVARLIARPERVLPPVIDVRTALPPPKDIPSTQYWTRMGYGFPGYGWNTLSWLLELYYRTGDRQYAREFIRLGLHPMPADVPTLKKVNAESFWDFMHPLATPYHYMGHYIVLLWDLVEEQDVFTDAERLAVTRELAKQITHPDINMRYLDHAEKLPPAEIVGDRHAQWSAMMMYVLARYMDRDYPHRVWKAAIKSAEYFHEPMMRPGTWGAPSSTFGWYASSMLNETAQYLVMTGGKPHPEGMLITAAKVYEILWEPGIKSLINDTMSAHNHRLLGTLTGDGKYYFYAADIDWPSKTMKLGQSFVSARDKARVPEELIGKWLVAPMPPAGCRRFGMKEPFDGLTLNTGYRDTLSGGGDRVMFDLFNELGRAPYQLNSLYLLRVDGFDYLTGYVNYLQVLKNGVSGQHIPIAARLRGTGQARDFAFHTSAVPDMAHAEWERTLLLHKRDAAVIADRITAREPGRLQAVLNWQTAQSPESSQGNRIVLRQTMTLRASEVQCSADGPIEPDSAVRIAKLKKNGETFRLSFELKKPFSGRLDIRFLGRMDGAQGVDAAMDGKTLRRGMDVSHAGSDVERTLALGHVELAAGRHTLTLMLANPPGSTGTAIAVWRLLFAEEASAGVIAGAGMTAGRDFHLGETPELKAGESHTFFSVAAANAEAETVAGKPSAALLRVPSGKVLVFAGEFAPFGKGRVVWVDEAETATLGDDFKLTVRPTSAEAKKALSSLRGVPYRPVPAEKIAATQPAYLAEPGWTVGLMEPVVFRGKPAVFVGSGSRAAVYAADGRELLRLTFAGRARSLHGTGKLLLVGTAEEKLYAFDETGKLLWTHIAKCATPPEKQKHYYWYKGAYPGVYAISSLKDEIYTGGACTVERIGADGKVIRRYEQFWGPVTWLAPFRCGDGEERMLSARLNTCHSAELFLVDPKRDTSSSAFQKNLPGWRNFTGFNAMRRSQVVPADVTGDGKQELVAASCGMYSWINLYDNSGKPLAQVNLGGRPMLSGLAAGRDLVVSVDPLRRLMIFDGKLNVRVCRELWFNPRDVVIWNGRLAVLYDNGVMLFDRDGKTVGRLAVPGAQRMKRLTDGTLAVADSRGKIAFFPERK